MSVNLPLEVWLKIFEHATSVTNEYDTHPPDYFSYPPPNTDSEIQRLKLEILGTKLSLVLVCKSWNRYATQFLYSSVVLRKLKNVGVFARRLEESQHVEREDVWNCRPFHLWIRRIDFCMSEAYPEGSERNLFSKVVQLPNLEIIVAGGRLWANRYKPFCAADSLSLIYAPKLSVLDVKHPMDSATRILISSLSTMRLKKFTAWPSVKTRALDHSYVSSIQYLNLTSLILSEPYPNLLTSVTHLVFHNTLSLRVNHVKFVLKAVSDRLTTLEFVDNCSMDRFLACVSQIRLPRLRNLVLELQTLGRDGEPIEWLIRFTELAKVTSLGLRLYRQRCKKADCRRAFQNILIFFDHCPSTRVIRFLDKGDVTYLRRDHKPRFDGFIKELLFRYNEKIALEDGYGKSYAFFLSLLVIID